MCLLPDSLHRSPPPHLDRDRVDKQTLGLSDFCSSGMSALPPGPQQNLHSPARFKETLNQSSRCERVLGGLGLSELPKVIQLAGI